MYEKYNLEKKTWEVIDNLLLVGQVLFSSPNRQDCADYIEQHAADITAYQLFN